MTRPRQCCIDCGAELRGHAEALRCRPCWGLSRRGPRRREPIIMRLFRRVTIEPSGCWTWTGYVMPCGHGQIQQSREAGAERVHRVVWQFFHGPIPTDAILHHVCDNKVCVRPDHLALTTRSEHIKIHVPSRRMVA